MIPERREDRELCADLVKVQWKTESGKTKCEWGILEDISPSGACLEMEKNIKPDTLISMEFPTDRCQARVIYCRFDKVKYLMGVEFEQGYRWSRRKFKPRHLIQFRLRKVAKSE
ncbi:MAG: PilZ domain-containing protein [Acidobacteria bacterium]|nr:PilZ domain-containing protein [Acidobacteriota bacterium]